MAAAATTRAARVEIALEASSSIELQEALFGMFSVGVVSSASFSQNFWNISSARCFTSAAVSTGKIKSNKFQMVVVSVGVISAFCSFIESLKRCHRVDNVPHFTCSASPPTDAKSVCVEDIALLVDEPTELFSHDSLVVLGLISSIGVELVNPSEALKLSDWQYDAVWRSFFVKKHWSILAK